MKDLSTEELQTRHKEINDRFLPTLANYQKMAADVLAIQTELFRRELKDAFPKAEHTKLVFINSLSARLTPTKFAEMLGAIKSQEVQIEAVIYDPMRFEFRVFARDAK